MTKTKVLIIGGGPAGSTAAYYLAKTGIKPIVLDKDKWPRDKVCGGGLTVNCLPVLERMGLTPELENKIGYKFDNYVAHWPDGTSIGTNLHILKNGKTVPVSHSYVVRRDEFDQLLLSHARKAGAIIKTETEAKDVKCEDTVVVTTKDEETFEADVLIVADGSGGPISRKFQKNIHKGSAIAARGYYSGVKGLSSRMECFLSEAEGWCFGWIFPLSEDRANIGFGIDVAYKNRKKINLKSSFLKLLESPVLKERMKDAKLEGEIEAFPLRMGYDKSLFRKGRVLFAGDSAKLIYPLSGEGIAYALQSGEIAAGVITDAFSGGNLTLEKLSDYERKCWKEFDDFHYAQRMQGWMGQPKLLGFMFRNACYDRNLGTHILSILEHSLKAKSFFSFRMMLNVVRATVKRMLKV